MAFHYPDLAPTLNTSLLFTSNIYSSSLKTYSYLQEEHQNHLLIQDLQCTVLIDTQSVENDNSNDSVNGTTFVNNLDPNASTYGKLTANSMSRISSSKPIVE